MATVTKTAVEGDYDDSYKSTWTFTATGTDQTVNSTFTLTAPTSTAKFVYSGKNKAGAYYMLYVSVLGASTANKLFSYGFPSSGYDDHSVLSSWASNSVKQMTLVGSSNSSISLSTLFKASNKTARSVSVTCTELYIVTVRSTNNNGDYNGIEYRNAGAMGEIATITLDAPPTVSGVSGSYASPQYAGLGVYTASITSAVAQYGGDISSVTLTIGADSTTKTYSSSSISNETITVTPSIAGTYTPTLAVTDSRGQTTTTALTAITVNGYTAPSLNFDVFRTNSSGVKDDEGAYGLITAAINFTDAIATLTQPAVTIDGTPTNNVTWYSAYNSSTGVSSAISDWTTFSSGDTIYGLINGSFSGSQSYVIGVTETDSQGGVSPTITQTLSTAFYTIDFQAGGKEIAFGAPANDDISDTDGKDFSSEGLFKCRMGTSFNDMSAQEVDDFVDNLNVGGGGVAVDLVIEQGISAGWQYRKWNSGIAECWYRGNYGQITLSTQLGTDIVSATFSLTFPFEFTDVPVCNFNYESNTSGYCWVQYTNTNPTTTTQSYGIRLARIGTSSITLYNNYVSCYAVGKWK